MGKAMTVRPSRGALEIASSLFASASFQVNCRVRHSKAVNLKFIMKFIIRYQGVTWNAELKNKL